MLAIRSTPRVAAIVAAVAGACLMLGGCGGGSIGGSAASGSSAGASNAQASAGNIQYRYDAAYAQCMSAKGDSVQTPQAGYAAGYGYPAGYPGYAYPAYPYPASPYAYGPGYGYGGPTVVVGGGWGGWGGGGWRGGYRHW